MVFDVLEAPALAMSLPQSDFWPICASSVQFVVIGSRRMLCVSWTSIICVQWSWYFQLLSSYLFFFACTSHSLPRAQQWSFLRTHESTWRCSGRTRLIWWTDVPSVFATHSGKPPGKLSCLGANNKEQEQTQNPNPDDESAWRPHKSHSGRGSDSEFRRIRGFWLFFKFDSKQISGSRQTNLLRKITVLKLRLSRAPAIRSTAPSWSLDPQHLSCSHPEGDHRPCEVSSRRGAPRQPRCQTQGAPLLISDGEVPKFWQIGLCHLLLNAEICHGVWSFLGRHRAKIRVQTVGHTILGNQLLSNGQHPICVAEIRDILDTSSLLSVFPCVLFVHFHREPGLTHLHTTELGPTVHYVTLEGWHHTCEQSTRALGGDNALASADETRVFRWIQLHPASWRHR